MNGPKTKNLEKSGKYNFFKAFKPAKLTKQKTSSDYKFIEVTHARKSAAAEAV